MKPVCYPCNEFIDENSLSTLFGKDYAENLVYELYNPNDEKIENSKISELNESLPKTFQSPTMAPFCKDEDKYILIDNLTSNIKKLKNDNIKIDGLTINKILTVNGIRFSLEDGSWGLIRASSNKPSLVVVAESTTSDTRKKEIFNFIDDLLKKTGKVGDYDQKI